MTKTNNIITKTYLDKKLKNFVTKKYLTNYIDKKLAYYPTKIDLEKRLKYFRIDLRDEMVEEFERIATNIKSDFYTKIDPFLKEIQTAQEERTIITHQLAEINDKLSS